MEVADSTWELAHGCLTFAECVVKNTSLKADNLEHAVLKVQQLLTALRPPAPVSTAASAADVTVEGGAPVVSASVPMQAAGSSHEMEGDSCDVVNAAGVTVQDGAPVVAGSSNKMEYDSYESSTDAEPDSDYVGTDEQEDDQLEPRRSKREGKGKISRTFDMSNVNAAGKKTAGKKTAGKRTADKKTAGKKRVDNRPRALCIHTNCTARRYYGYQGKKPQFCAVHKTASMVYTGKPVCMVDTCYRPADFGILHESRQCCSIHKTVGMVNLAHRHCATEGCYKRPWFAWSNRVMPTHCCAHRKLGMKSFR